MRALLVVALLSGCARTELDVTVTMAPALTDGTLARARGLRVETRGADSWQSSRTLPSDGAHRVESFVYRAGASSGRLELSLSLLDGAGQTLGCADDFVDLKDGQAIPVALTMSPCTDGPPTDAGMPGDGGQSDVGMPLDQGAIVPGCGGGGNYLLCDDFEKPNVDTSKWTSSVVTAGGMVFVDGVFPHRGTRSLHISGLGIAPVGNIYQQAVLTTTLPSVRPRPLYLRLFVYILPIIPEVHAILGKLQDQTAVSTLAFELYDAHAIRLEPISLSPPNRSDPGRTSATAYPIDRWACLEWMVRSGDVDAGTADGEMRFWLDETEVDDVRIGGIATDDLTRLYIGYEEDIVNYRGQIDLWIDDVIVDTQPIGCTR
jgi:hypothetical protein